MTRNHFLTSLLGVSISAFAIVIFFFIVFFIFCRRRKQPSTESDEEHDVESLDHDKQGFSSETEKLVTFQGGEDLTICDILDAPGEVIGKSSYGTLYKASLQRSGKVRVLRFLRPVCAVRSDSKEFSGVIETLGFVRHENLVPLLGFYAGTRGEKLMVHPFFSSGNLSDIIRSGDGESIKWSNILRITIGMSEALDYLHSGMQKTIVHGNLKSKNVLLNSSFEPRISDFGLHLLLNLAAGQEILDVSAAEGYKAPELIKMKDVSKESDVYSLGVIMLELVSGKEPINDNPTGDSEFYLPDFMRNAVLDHKLSDLYRPEILTSSGNNLSEECVLKYFQLAMSCCSPSPSLRPNMKQVLRKLEDIRKC
uniref:Protein kinase n=1 Tax=Sisymbrium irio TaxID=3730 RepID=Q6V5I0_SISIR|nr:protein kinase [Sisymbrium irio]